MQKHRLWSIVVPVLALVGSAAGDAVTFALLNHPDNKTLLPQPKGLVGIVGDHLVRTPDDVTASSFNPNGGLSFTFTNPIGIWEPDYPPGYAEGIHCMTGTFDLEVDLGAGGAVKAASLAFDGYVAPNKYTAQRLVRPGDTAANGNYGPIDGQPNTGSYSASANANWALELNFDWCFDTPYAGMGTLDMTFSDYRWSGFIIPVGQLTPAGLGLVALDDPLAFFGGTSADFESWLLNEVTPTLPADATWLLFAQGTAHPAWTHPAMGMTTDGLVDQTVLAYTTIPEPATGATLLAGTLCGLAHKRRRKRQATRAGRRELCAVQGMEEPPGPPKRETRQSIAGDGWHCWLVQQC